MNRYESRTEIVLHSRAGVVFAALPVRQRRAAGSERLLLTVARRVLRPVMATMRVVRRPVRDDEMAQAALIRLGSSSTGSLHHPGTPIRRP